MFFARRAACLSAALFAIAASPAWASSIGDPICPDRPGKSSSTCTVPTGQWQTETSLAAWSLTKAGAVRTTQLSIASTAVKYGVTDTMHVEVGFTPYVRVRQRVAGGHDRDSGFGDVVVKVKRTLTPDGAAFSAALYPFVKLPTASKHLGNGKVEGGVIVPFSLELKGTPLSLSSSPELDLIGDGDGRGYHLATAQTLAVGLAATDKLSMAAELWGAWNWDEGETVRQASVGGNAAYRITNNLQIDGQLDFGINRATPDIAIAGGVSIRF